MTDQNKHPIVFVGAGPGAPDLITVRGARALACADKVIWAGSLVNPEILEMTRPGTVFHDSASLVLPEIIQLMSDGYESGQRVVRLHTGDPSIFGAVNEQFAALEERGIPYTVIPGVTAAFAAAAAIQTELTHPEIAQSVVITRLAGRTPVPEGESLQVFARTGATLCLYLSVDRVSEAVERCIAAGMSLDTPVAVISRVSWRDEKILRGTLSDISKKVQAAGLSRQAIIFIGEALGARDGASKLYDVAFAHGYRAVQADSARSE